jgi:hypothetical protein
VCGVAPGEWVGGVDAGGSKRITSWGECIWQGRGGGAAGV